MIDIENRSVVRRFRLFWQNLSFLKRKEIKLGKNLLGLMVWLFFLGGLFGFAMGMMKFFGGGTLAEYGVMGMGGEIK